MPKSNRIFRLKLKLELFSHNFEVRKLLIPYLQRNEGKENFTEDEVNQLLNLLGIFRLMDTFHIVERFKIEVTPLKSQESDDQSEPASAQAE